MYAQTAPPQRRESLAQAATHCCHVVPLRQSLLLFAVAYLLLGALELWSVPGALEPPRDAGDIAQSSIFGLGYVVLGLCLLMCFARRAAFMQPAQIISVVMAVLSLLAIFILLPLKLALQVQFASAGSEMANAAIAGVAHVALNVYCAFIVYSFNKDRLASAQQAESIRGAMS
eukprot:TRINITY_DN74570_c0_g1_i1.p1 TRINITY_DN74570_c0_g1~~TRINITY_DN74570_c0_g1_i1.p1  ORF type:complete len:173 (+),score=12.84 TRINITY_DN74570_c0_g1_i1:79-597(+)